MRKERSFLFVLLVTGLIGLWAMAPSFMVPKASGQIHGDSGVSNTPGGGFVIGYVDTASTNSAGTNYVVRQTRRPLGFFGNHSTNQLTVTNFTADAASTELSNLIAALRAYGLIITN